MNNIKKIGISALAGSLAMVSANAVEYTMSGGMMATYSTQKDNGAAEATNGKGLGTATDLSFNASGELDNGFTVGYFMSVDTNAALANTSSQMTIGMGSLGTLQLNNIGGSKANAIDDVTPNAYNETWDGLTGANSNPSFFGSLTSSGSIDYRIPTQDIAGYTLNASVTYDPNASEGAAAKGGVAATTVAGQAYTIELAHAGSGVSVGAGLETVDDGAGLLLSSDTEHTTAYVKYANGPLSLGAQTAYANNRNGTGTTGADTEAQFWSVAYTMGDLTLSYAESEMETKAVSTTAAKPTAELESIQAAYSMGAMTISAAMSETANPGEATGSYEENTLAVSFAF
mgnify:FL=1